MMVRLFPSLSLNCPKAMQFLVAILVLAPLVANSQEIETVIQRGHELAVISIATSPDSNLVVTGSRDKSAKLWDLHSLREVRSFLGHEYSVTTVAFTPDGKFLFTGSSDGTLRKWDVFTGREINKINPFNETITDIVISPDGKYYAVSCLKYAVRIYRLDTDKPVKELEANPEGNRRGVNLAFSADGNFLALGEDNRKASVYQTSDWKLVHVFEFGSGWCGGCATFVGFTPESKSLVMASHHGSVKQYDLENGKLSRQYADEISDPTSIQVSPDGRLLMVATEKDIHLWDIATGKAHPPFNAGNDKEINEVAFASNGKYLLITSNDNSCHLWNLAHARDAGSLTGFLNMRDKGGMTYDPNFIWDMQIAKYVRFKNHLLLTPDGKSLIKGKFGSKVKRWDIASGKTKMEYTGHSKAVLCYDLSRDGKRLITGGGDGRIILWDTETGDSIRVIKAHREPILDVQFCSDESKVAASSWDATLATWDLSSGKAVNYFDFENNSALNLLWGPSDLYLFTSQGKDLRLLELDSKTAVRDFVGHQDIIGSIRLSNDQQQLLSASWDGSIRLWNVSSGLMTKKFLGHHGAVHTAVFSPDERYIYSAGADRQIRVWEVLSGKTIRTLDGHKAEVTSLIFSPDHSMLISHSVDGATKFWDLNTGKEFFEHIHFGENEWMVKNPEGYFNGTQEARSFIHFVDGLKTYSVDQFFEEFFRPDLLPRIFQERGGDELKGLKGKLLKSPPPQVKLAVVPTTEPGKADVFIKIIDTGSGLGTIRLFQNGKSIPIKYQEIPTQEKDQTFTYRQTINLVAGNNTITASVSNKDKIESDPVSTEVFSEQAGQTSTCYILAVGINQYKNQRMTLNYARPDAESFAEIMNNKSASLFRKVEVITLFDNDATRQNILAKLDDIASRIGQEDVFVFYYAGHGSMVEDKFFFIPTESSRLYDIGSLQKEAIEAGALQEKFRNIRALKQLIVMDACQSGGSVELLATRGAAEEKAIAQLSRSAGIHVMASAGSDQFATEFAQLHHGLFTYLLIKALQGDADGAPKDGKVTIYELKSYLDDQVPEMTHRLKGKPQYPYTFSRGQDFPVVIEN